MAGMGLCLVVVASLLGQCGACLLAASVLPCLHMPCMRSALLWLNFHHAFPQHALLQQLHRQRHLWHLPSINHPAAHPPPLHPPLSLRRSRQAGSLVQRG